MTTLNLITEKLHKAFAPDHASELHSWGVDQAGDLVSAHSETQGRAAVDGLQPLKEKIRQI